MDISSMGQIEAMLNGELPMPAPKSVPKESQPLELKMLELLDAIEKVAGIKPDAGTLRYTVAHRNIAACMAKGKHSSYSLSLGYLLRSVTLQVPFFYCSVNDSANNFRTIATYRFSAETMEVLSAS